MGSVQAHQQKPHSYLTRLEGMCMCMCMCTCPFFVTLFPTASGIWLRSDTRSARCGDAVMSSGLCGQQLQQPPNSACTHFLLGYVAHTESNNNMSCSREQRLTPTAHWDMQCEQRQRIGQGSACREKRSVWSGSKSAIVFGLHPCPCNPFARVILQ